jgi:hypothetical protein
VESSFDEFGDYKHHVIVQHLEYFQRQDGELLEDVIEQCVLDAQTSQVPDEITFYDAHETELGMSAPEDSYPEPTSLLVLSLSQSVTLTTTSYGHFWLA